ncbi:AAA family ATPase [Streptomyces sp. MS191]|uniref:AAA family ATPase n=1 Tax=Streptomyces sp. ms191 TaxID=1827978 RepID=UPI0021C92A2B|nr:MoxR family ATPase [Streptomyces sp. ms191]
MNAALMLRRPLLVTGPPGSGKSSLAYHIAHELRLGRVLTWPITSRTALRDGLYSYDAIGRLQEAGLAASARSGRADRGVDAWEPRHQETPDIGAYVRLGPLGTALLPADRPRVLLIDEIDKSDLDLPNDLLHVLENGEFVIPELARLAGSTRTVRVHTDDGALGVGGDTAEITEGWVGCTTFPFVVLTSNGEREFPAAFLRRCIRLDLPAPDVEGLIDIVQSHLGREGVDRGRELIHEFVRRRENGTLSTDQLLNAIYLLLGNGTAEARSELLDQVLRPLGPAD